MPTFKGIKLVLLDIEGTICSISFVKDVLFPYALKTLPDVLATKWDDAEFAPYKAAFPEEARQSPTALQEHVQDLTRRDVKVAYLKGLQGYLWQSGYESGAYATELYPDVIPRLRTWKQDAGAELVIFSSGSVFAQKLLFSHVQTSSTKVDSDETASTLATEDMTGLISDWFDTVNAGAKTEAASYEKIAAARSVKTEQIVFFSDNVKEIAAAKEAGMPAVLVDRPGNAPLADDDKEAYDLVTSLDQVDIDSSQTGRDVADEEQATSVPATDAVEGPANVGTKRDAVDELDDEPQPKAPKA